MITHRLPAVLASTAIMIMLAGAMVWWPTIPASAHVHADGQVVVGGYGVITFRVPTESDTARTVALTVSFPTDTAFASVSAQAKSGWKVTQTRRKLAQPTADAHGASVDSVVATLTWTATGTGIPPGEFDTFAVSLGPIPDVATLTFPTVQTYSNETTVSWTEVAEGGATPEHPAPVVTVAPASPASTAPSDRPSSADGNGLALGIAGVTLATLALAVAVATLVRTGRRSVRS